MRVTLGMIVKDEEFFLERIMPIVAPCFDEIVVADAESTDGSRGILAKFGARVIVRPWTNDYGAARNFVISQATGDWMFMLDADEAMFPSHIAEIRKAMERTTYIYIPRIEFVGDFDHCDDSCYPDNQGRIFRMGMGYHFRGKLHETVYRNKDHGSAWEMNYGLYLPNCPIYHYGQCKPPDKVWLKHHNYGLLSQGKPLLTEVPQGMTFSPRIGPKVFVGEHPLKGR